MKLTRVMCAAACLALLAAACGGNSAEPAKPATPEAPDHLVGLHASDLTKGFRERGLTCKDAVLEKDTWHYVCESSTPLVQYRGEFYAKVPGRVEYIRVLVAQSGAPKVELAAPLLAFLANLRYEGADPDRARAWVEQAITAPGQTQFGIAKFKVSGDLSRLVLEVKAAGSEW
ncbi:MAG: hypothetical protein ACM3H9_02440 [Rhodospirillaceae bacterium]